MSRIRMYRNIYIVVVVLAGVFVPSVSAQDSEAARCADYPEFCVPHVGRVPTIMARHELLSASDGLVRGMTADSLFFLGNPAAPAHFLVFLSFTCSHCSGYYQIELVPFINAYVLSGQAALHVGLLSFSMQPYSDNAVNAAMCAGEQGAFWEMQHELFVQGSHEGVQVAFTPDNIQETARALGLDADRLWTCVESERYGFLMERFNVAALDLGISATPTVLLLHDGGWKKIARNYDNLVQLTADANTENR